jgi:hypothetical protein
MSACVEERALDFGEKIGEAESFEGNGAHSFGVENERMRA